MSEYFRVLKRIERDRREGETPAPRLAQAGPEHRHEPETEVISTPTLEVLPPRVLSPQSAAFATLFNNLRARAGEEPLRCLVFAGVSAVEPVHAVINGLAEHVEGVGLNVLRAELTQAAGGPLLRRHRHELSDGGDPLELDLHSREWHADFSRWLRAAAGRPDLVLIEGRPLAESIESAVLARACDGLVLVAQTEVTERTGLQTAAARARAAGCRVWGLVMYGTENHMPQWIRRLVGGTQPPPERLER